MQNEGDTSLRYDDNMRDGVRLWQNRYGDSIGCQKINFVDGEAADEREENESRDCYESRLDGRSNNMEEIAVCVCGNSEFEVGSNYLRCAKCGEMYKWMLDKDTGISKLSASGLVELVNSSSYGKVDGL